MPDPRSRKAEEFRHPDLRAWVRENRGGLVRAYCVLVRAWLDAGRPAGDRRLGSFEDWARVLGGILKVAGIDGFLGNLAEFYAEADTESAAWRTLLDRWWSRFKDGEARVSQILEFVEFGELGIDLGSGNEHSRRTKLGMLLDSRDGRTLGGYRLIKGASQQHANTWRLEPQSRKTPVL